MFNDYDVDLLFTQAEPGKPDLSEEELSAFDPLPEEHFGKDGQPPVSVAEALLRFREDISGLLHEGERLSRFSAEYIHTARLIRHNLTILGQGLMTLHKAGFDLSDYPLSIYELRCIASFHFKKIMNGARVALQTNPKVYYRCMAEYPEWVKLLCRLEVSERKLAEPVKVQSAPKPALKAAAAAVNLTEAQPFAETAALQPARALPVLSDSRRKALLSASEQPEETAAEPEKTEPAQPRRHSAQGAPFTFSAFTLPQCEASHGTALPGPLPRAHPPWED